jgi:hypothetical protein
LRGRRVEAVVRSCVRRLTRQGRPRTASSRVRTVPLAPRIVNGHRGLQADGDWLSRATRGPRAPVTWPIYVTAARTEMPRSKRWSRRALVCRSSADVLSLSAPEGGKHPRPIPRRPAKAPKHRELDEDERSVVEALERGPSTADEVCECTRLSAPRAQRAILMLTLSKVIQEVGCGRYARPDCL